MIKTLLLLRLKQGQRILAEVGLARTIVLVGFAVFYGTGMWRFLASTDLGEAMAVLWLTSTLGLHLRRKDKHFLVQVAGNVAPLYAIEYFGVALPLLVVLVAQGRWLAAALLTAGSLAIAWLPNRSQRLRKKFTLQFALLPALCFEWAAHLRKMWVYYVLAYVAALALAQYMVAIAMTMIATTLLLLMAHLPAESLAMLQAPALPARQLLHKKLALHLLLYGALQLPMAIVLAAAHPAYWYIAPALLVAGAILQTFAVLYKYATYTPGLDRMGNISILVMMAACYVTSYLMPVPLVMTMIYYFRAYKNLKQYL